MKQTSNEDNKMKLNIEKILQNDEINLNHFDSQRSEEFLFSLGLNTLSTKGKNFNWAENVASPFSILAKNLNWAENVASPFSILANKKSALKPVKSKFA